MVLYNFLVGNIVISAVIVGIFTLKKLLYNYISPKYSCYINYVLIFILVMPLIPEINIKIPEIAINESTVGLISTTYKSIGKSRDLYISVNKNYAVDIMLIGIAFLKLMWLVISYLRFNYSINVKISNKVFSHICGVMRVKASLYKSKNIKIPLSFGLITKKVVMPERILNDSKFDVVIIHELFHHKHNDILVNYILCILSALYWFNPIVYITIKQIRLDMEIYCDYKTVKFTGDNIKYGNIILDFISDNKKHIMTNSISDVYKQIKKRIIKISEYNKAYSRGINNVIVLSIVCISIIPALYINSLGYTINYNYSNISEEYIDLRECFKNIKGTFVLYDNNADKFLIYNKKLAHKRVPPDSSFKIPLAAMGLEEGIITTENNKIKWDGRQNPFEVWNKNQDLNSAMEYSVNWYFQNMDLVLGKNRIIKYIQKFNYGNQSVHSSKNYWLENSLKISPVEQTLFLKCFVKNEYNLKAENVNKVMQSIKIAEGLYGKTGTGMVNGKINSGWFVGISENNGNIYPFAVRIEDNDGMKAKEIALKILRNIEVV